MPQFSNIGLLNLEKTLGGKITVESNNLVISDIGFISSANVDTGTGGDIFVKSSNLTISNNANLASINFGFGKGGNVFIKSKRIEVDGTGLLDSPLTTISASTAGAGSAGNLSIDTSSIKINNGGENL